MEALSDSTVIRLCSGLMVSPGLTSTSMTATDSKSPMSGTLISMRAMVFVSRRSEQHAAEIAEHLGQIGVETGTGSAVDHAVVIGQRERQGQTRLEGLAVPDRLHRAAGQAQDGHFRRVDQRREVGRTDATQG